LGVTMIATTLSILAELSRSPSKEMHATNYAQLSRIRKGCGHWT